MPHTLPTDAQIAPHTVRPPVSLSVCVLWFIALLLLVEAATQVFEWLKHQLPLGAGAWRGVVAQNALFLSSVLLFAGPLLVLERFFPRTDTPRHYGRALWFWAMYLPVAWGSSVVAGHILGVLGIQPLLQGHLDAWALSGPVRFAANVGLLLAGMVLFDFFYYWLHRMQHRSAFLWRFHQTHHANRYINALSCYHHPLEDILRIPLFTIPMALAFRIDAPQILFLSSFFSCWAFWSHMDSPLNFGVLRCVVVDNRYHRLHHSIAREHFDRNFAAYFTPWDRLFGTQVMPDVTRQGEVQVGLEGVASPVTAKDLWLMPLTR